VSLATAGSLAPSRLVSLCVLVELAGGSRGGVANTRLGVEAAIRALGLRSVGYRAAL